MEDPDPADDIWTVGPLADDENWQTDSGYPGYGLRYVDAAFCAEARTMVPALLAEVRRLRAEVPHA